MAKSLTNSHTIRLTEEDRYTYTDSEYAPHLAPGTWLTYAWLLRHSEWNSTETHYYIYNNAFTNAQIAADIHMSGPTVTRGIKELLANGIITAGKGARGLKWYIFEWVETTYAIIPLEVLEYFY